METLRNKRVFFHTLKQKWQEKTSDIIGGICQSGASDGNRTRVSTLARSRSTIELHLHVPFSFGEGYYMRAIFSYQVEI